MTKKNILQDLRDIYNKVQGIEIEDRDVEDVLYDIREYIKKYEKLF